jgi:23S rRNA pseudouridine955/2504/2580 synthase
MFLHARRLKFQHPASGEAIELLAPLPPECALLLQALTPLPTPATPPTP